MNDLNEQPNEDATEATAEAANEAAFTVDDIERRYFSPDVLETDAQDYLAVISELDVPIKKNFEDEVPEGYGVTVLPIAKRGEDGNEVIGVCVAAIPDSETIAAHEKGADFIRDLIINSFQAKVANSVRPRSNGSTAGSIPFSIEDFIEGRRGAGSLKTYTALASTFVKAIKKMGIGFMTSVILKQTLQSAAFATSQFASIPQENWEKVLHAMITKAKADGLDPAILQHWADTRNEAEMHVAEDLDFSAFEDME